MNEAPGHLENSRKPRAHATEAPAAESRRARQGIADPAAATAEAGIHASIASILPSLRIFISLASAALLIAGLYLGQELLVPLALAILLSFLLDPLVSGLKRWGIPRAAGALIVVAIALGALFGAGTYLAIAYGQRGSARLYLDDQGQAGETARIHARTGHVGWRCLHVQCGG